MEIIAFVASKGGAGRTAASLLLATGLCEFEMNPLHIQVLAAGRRPVLDGATDVPFETAWIDLDDHASTSMDIRRCAARHPRCFPIVVDMPAERIRGDLVADGDTRILLPMGDGAPELEWAAHDYYDAVEALARHAQRKQKPNVQRPPAWFLPIGWPRSLRAEDFAFILRRFGVMIEDRQPFPIVLPGVPRLDRWDLDSLVNNERFEATLSVQGAAETLARAVLTKTNSPLLNCLRDHPDDGGT